MNKELPYWIVFAHLPHLNTKAKNQIIVQLHNEEKTLIDFFHQNPLTWQSDYGLDNNVVLSLKQAMKDLSNSAFVAEDLQEQGYRMIPITSPEYSPILKTNLGKSFAPTLLYTKGDTSIMKASSLSIIGTNSINNNSLEFIDNIAKRASLNSQIIVAGYNESFDKKVLDTVIANNGKGIIVIPQGISTFGSGYKKYYKSIFNGNILVLSIVYPSSIWNPDYVQLCRQIVYGMCSNLYVSHSSNSDTSWGMINAGLKKGKEIFVRVPNTREKNDNSQLIKNGATPVNLGGQKIDLSPETSSEPSQSEKFSTKKMILELLKNGFFTPNQIMGQLNITWNIEELTDFLDNEDEIMSINAKPKVYSLAKGQKNPQTSLF